MTRPETHLLATPVGVEALARVSHYSEMLFVHRSTGTRTDLAAIQNAIEAVRELFEGEGFEWTWGAAERWYAAHPRLDGHASASLDRVIGRNVDFWLDAGSRGQPGGRRIRRLQSEVQLLLYPHPINAAREAA